MSDMFAPEPSSTRFQPGQSGNPAGRPRGARAKLGEAFLTAVLADWEAKGSAALAELREQKPADYVKLVASILPREPSDADGEPSGFIEIQRIVIRPQD